MFMLLQTNIPFPNNGGHQSLFVEDSEIALPPPLQGEPMLSCHSGKIVERVTSRTHRPFHSATLLDLQSPAIARGMCQPVRSLGVHPPLA